MGTNSVYARIFNIIEELDDESRKITNITSVYESRKMQSLIFMNKLTILSIEELTRKN